MTELRQVPVTQTASKLLKPAPTVSSPRGDRNHGPSFDFSRSTLTAHL
jgi:hypothetical protein